MYCSISCSRAARSPCSWYLRSSSLSLSPTGATSNRDLLREADPVAVDMHVVDRRLEHASQRQRLILFALDLVEHAARERPDPGLELAVAHRHSHRGPPEMSAEPRSP